MSSWALQSFCQSVKTTTWMTKLHYWFGNVKHTTRSHFSIPIYSQYIGGEISLDGPTNKYKSIFKLCSHSLSASVYFKGFWWFLLPCNANTCYTLLYSNFQQQMDTQFYFICIFFLLLFSWVHNYYTTLSLSMSQHHYWIDLSVSLDLDRPD